MEDRHLVMYKCVQKANFNLLGNYENEKTCDVAH
jgi:hypothetical protein